MPDQTYITIKTEEGDMAIAEDVFMRIVTAAINEIEGVAGLAATIGSDVTEYLGAKSMPRGIRLSSDENGAALIDIVVLVRYGFNIPETAESVQERVVSAVESMTGLNSVVNVHVSGISFEKAEKK